MNLKRTVLLCLVLHGAAAPALTLRVSPGRDDRGQLTVFEPQMDGALIDFGPVALFQVRPRTGSMIPVDWGFWLLATLRVTVEGASKPARLFARALPQPGVRLRWAGGRDRTDWNSDGFGVDIASAERVVAEGDTVNGSHQLALGIEDTAGPGQKTVTVFLTAIEN